MPPPSKAGAPPRIVVVRRIKKGGHAHHGGAWKVAYADFVTAMMAFFLLMWLLASTEAGDRVQIANYFKRPLSAVLSTGGQPGGDRVIAQSEGSQAEQDGQLSPGSSGVLETEAAEATRLQALEAEFDSLMQSNPLFAEFADQLQVDLTEEGLRVQLIDQQQRPMFGSGSAVLQPYTRALITEIARALDGAPNNISISGHTDATPYPGGEAGYSNWELSADRANAARRVLVAAGISEGKVARVEGLASSQLLFPDRPHDPANRRISILLLRAAHSTPLGDAITLPSRRSAREAAAARPAAGHGAGADDRDAPTTSAGPIPLPVPAGATPHGATPPARRGSAPGGGGH